MAMWQITGSWVGDCEADWNLNCGYSVSIPTQRTLSLQGQLISTNESWGVNKHTTW